MAWSQSTRELRAFDWVDYILYLLATYWFASAAMVLILTGEPPDSLPLKFGLSPNLTNESDQGFYRFLVSVFAVFVIFVYLRNYIVMHAIDDRKDGEHALFYFVDYNTGWWSRSERLFRALIVLWVLTTAIGTVPFVTNAVWKAIEWFVSSIVGYVTFQELTLMQAFFAFYGFVIFVLFLLFIAWDTVNIFSISRQMKTNAFDKCVLGPDKFGEVIGERDLDFAIPEKYQRIIPVYSIVAYISPRKFVLGDIAKPTKGLGPSGKIQKAVAEGALFKLYVSLSRKFMERLTGLTVGALLLLVPLIGEGATSIVLLGTLLGALFVYGTVMISYVPETIKGAFQYFMDFLRYAAPRWTDPDRAKALGNENGIPPCGP
jgi:hypothetical protein